MLIEIAVCIISAPQWEPRNGRQPPTPRRAVSAILITANQFISSQYHNSCPKRHDYSNYCIFLARISRYCLIQVHCSLCLRVPTFVFAWPRSVSAFCQIQFIISQYAMEGNQLEMSTMKIYAISLKLYLCWVKLIGCAAKKNQKFSR